MMFYNIDNKESWICSNCNAPLVEDFRRPYFHSYGFSCKTAECKLKNKIVTIRIKSK